MHHPITCSSRFFHTACDSAQLEFAFLVTNERFVLSNESINYETHLYWRNPPLEIRLVFEMPDIPKLSMACLIGSNRIGYVPIAPPFPEALQFEVNSYFHEIEELSDTSMEKAFLDDRFSGIQVAVIRHYAEHVRKELSELQRSAADMVIAGGPG